MTTYDKFNAALLTNAYKRGAFKGDAPADRSRRSRNHVRIVRGHDCIHLRMYSTNIITAYPDGRISLDLRGYSSSITTRQNLNQAFAVYVPFRPYIHCRSVFSLSQECITIASRTYKYEDGMEFNNYGELLTAPARFEAVRIDKDASTEFQRDLKESGFKDMFPVLYATATPTQTTTSWVGSRLRDRLTLTGYANDWPDIVADYKYVSLGWRNGQWNRNEREGGDKACWSALMATAKTDLHETVKSDTTVILDNETPKFSPATATSTI